MNNLEWLWTMKALAYLNKYLWKYKVRLGLGALFIILSNLFGVKMPRLVNDTIGYITSIVDAGALDSEGAQDELINTGLWLACLYVLFSIGKGFFLFLTRQTIIVMSRKIEFDLKNEVYLQYQRMSTAFYKRNNTGDLMNRISEDVSKVRMYLGPGIMYTINLTVLSSLVIYQMFTRSTELTGYVLLPLPIMAFLIYKVSHIINRESEQVQRQQSKMSTYVQEFFSGIRVVKAYRREHAFQEEFAIEAQEYMDRSIRLVKVNSLFLPVVVTLIGLSTILAVYLGAIMVVDPTVSFKVGDIAEFIIYVNMLTWPFASVGWVTSIIQRAAASQVRINEFLKEEPEIQNLEEAQPFNGSSIAFKNVSFTYPNSGMIGLDGVNFEIKQGQSLGIMGGTGSGKSTIANLICRLYDVSSGQIAVGGSDLKTLDLNDVRQKIGYVPQEVFLFSDTIANNIRFGIHDDKLSDQDIETAAKDSCVHENIVDFKDGYETILGERGITLSGGQKQRVSIARAVIKSPEVLIFDDCLSAVDHETEEAILRNLKRIMQNKTTVIISHRVSSVMHCDKIIMLDQGKIVEYGNHQSLLEERKKYYVLYQKQLEDN